MKRMALVGLAMLSGMGCTQAKEKPLQVSMFTEVDTLTIMKAHLAQAEKATGVKAESAYIPYNNYGEKLVAMLAARTCPDIVWIDVDLFVELQSQGAFISLEPFLKKEPIELKAYYPEVTERFNVGGEQFAIPQDTAPIACLYYNKDMFRKAGVKAPKGDWTWNEFLAAGKKLAKKGKGPNDTVWAFQDNYGPDWGGIVLSNGGRLVDDVKHPTRCTLDEPAAIEAIQFYVDLIHKYELHPPATARNNILALGQDEFATGRLAMFRSGIWVVPFLRKIRDFKWDMVPFPSGPHAPGGKGRWRTGGSGYAISRDCKKPEEAWKLVKFLSSASSQEAYARTGYVQPAVMSLVKSGAYTQSTPPDNKGFLDAAVKRSVYQPADKRWREVENSVILNELTELFRTGGDAAPVMKRITEKVNKALFKP